MGSGLVRRVRRHVAGDPLQQRAGGAGQSFIFNSIIAVVVGGVLLTGGYGSVVGIVLGTLTFSVVNQGIYYTGFDANWASLIIGVLLLAAVLMNNTFRNMALTYAPRSKGRHAHDDAPAQAHRINKSFGPITCFTTSRSRSIAARCSACSATTAPASRR